MKKQTFECEKYIPKVGDCVKYDNGAIFECTGHDGTNDPISGIDYIYKNEVTQENNHIGFNSEFIFTQITTEELQAEFNKLGYEYNFETHTAEKIRWKP